MHYRNLLLCLIVLVPAVFFFGCEERSVSPKHECTDITTGNLGMSNVEITSSELVTDDTEYDDYCLVSGKVNERTGIDGKTYAIGFEFRLPSAWNKRFLYQANGGSDGSVESAIGELNGTGDSNALARGFAVISTDAGHDGADPENQSYGFNQGVAFGLDPQARLDYGYTSTGTMAPVAKDIIKYYYGRKPKYSYMAGCSNGGRHGMVAASRYPGYFDGILAGAPGFNLPKTALQHAWDVQSFEMVNGDMRSAFSTDDLQAVADAVLDACDDLDGVEDGMVYDIAGCQDVFDLSTADLTTDQQAALAQSMGGPVNSGNEQLYSDWPYDPGMATNNWSFWKLNSGLAFWDNYPLIVTMGGGSLSYVFTTPPTETPGDLPSILSFLENFDFDIDAPKINATTGTFTESALEFMRPTDADNPTLDSFRKKGGKLLMYHGQSDGAFSVNDTINWYEKLVANTEDDARDFARLFIIPGMGHCSGGCATDRFDALGALMDWVEKGEAPDQLFAWVDEDNTELPSEWSTTRTRPLCVWPEIAVYLGDDVESADSFECRLSIE